MRVCAVLFVHVLWEFVFEAEGEPKTGNLWVCATTDDAAQHKEATTAPILIGTRRKIYIVKREKKMRMAPGLVILFVCGRFLIEKIYTIRTEY